MPRPYSEDLRVRMVGAVDAGMSARAAARVFGISASTAVKWVQRWRRTGSEAAKRMGGYLSLPKILSTAENLGFSSDGRNRDVPIRVHLATAGCDLQLRRMEFLVGTGALRGCGRCHGEQ